ncbi:GATA transcription factor 16 [Linum grandiflorum]
METESTSSAIPCRQVVEESEDHQMMFRIRRCIDCHTTTTPCWRGGPAGPRTLCNACGIRYRKSRNSASSASSSSPSSSSGSVVVAKKKRKMVIGKGKEAGVPVKKLLGLMGLDSWNWKMMKKQQLGEEERAAILLMSLSGSISSSSCY